MLVETLTHVHKVMEHFGVGGCEQGWQKELRKVLWSAPDRAPDRSVFVRWLLSGEGALSGS
jgi:hypothetical protein